MEWVRLNYLIKPLVLHFPNEGRRTKRFGQVLKDMGMRPGVSDLFIAMASHEYHGAWIELKSTNGIVSVHQRQFLFDMSNEGYCVQVIRSIDECIEFIKWYCNI